MGKCQICGRELGISGHYKPGLSYDCLKLGYSRSQEALAAANARAEKAEASLESMLRWRNEAVTRAERAEAEIVNEQRRFGEMQRETWKLDEALAAARRECDAARDAHAYCLHMFPRDWLTDLKNRSIFAAAIFTILDGAAPAAGEES